MFRNALLQLNNRLARWRLARCRRAGVVLLAPHCLQRRACGRDVVSDPGVCERCGACDVSQLLALRDIFGVRLHVASGGRQALALVRRRDVRGVIAVACENELIVGIRAAFPKPVLAIPNQRPHGPCRDTRVNPNPVETALRQIGSRCRPPEPLPDPDSAPPQMPATPKSSRR